jgi:hypothetical protein
MVGKGFFAGAAAVVALMVPLTAQAIVGGQPDGTAHPYVALITDGPGFCSGSLISPTVLVTAAHCFTTSSWGTNTFTGAPQILVSFDSDLINIPREQRVWWTGSYYPDPLYGSTKSGLTGFSTHDTAIVVFSSAGCHVPSDAHGIVSCGSIPTSLTGGRYAVLPAAGLVDALQNGAPVDVVGYGAQALGTGGGPCSGSCQPTVSADKTRYAGTTSLIAGNDRISGEYVKLHSNSIGMCFGDSGGPELLGGTDVLLAENSFVLNDVCSGVGYGQRLDEQLTLDWIATTAAANGGSLSH